MLKLVSKIKFENHKNNNLTNLKTTEFERRQLQLSFKTLFAKILNTTGKIWHQNSFSIGIIHNDGFSLKKIRPVLFSPLSDRVSDSMFTITHKNF